MDAEDARTIGRRLSQTRHARGKSLEVIAGLAGMSVNKLWRIEHEERSPTLTGAETNRTYHWVGYGRALAQLRGRHDDAVRALRRAETTYPLRVRRDPFVRDTLAVLLRRSHRNAIGRELRGMAYRAGLPV